MEPAPRDELVSLRARIDNSEYRWLKLLGDFDALVGWAAEGFRTPVTWLTHHCNLSRIGASERVRIARALRHRPTLDAAFADGRLSYSKVRAATRIDPAGNPRVDEILVEFAATTPPKTSNGSSRSGNEKWAKNATPPKRWPASTRPASTHPPPSTGWASSSW